MLYQLGKEGNAVAVRVGVSAQAAAQLGRELDLSARVDSPAIEKRLANYYRNKSRWS